MERKLILLTLLLVLIFPIVSAEVQTLGTFEKGECINLIQTCYNCTYVDITSVLSPDSTELLGLTSMNQTGTMYTHEFCNTSYIGQYIVNGIGDIDTIPTTWVYDFIVTPSGRTFDLSDIIIYSLFLLICLSLAYFSVQLIRGHPIDEDPLIDQKLYVLRKRNEFLYFIKVLKSKLWIIGAFGVYLSLLIFTTLLYQISYNLSLISVLDFLKYTIIIFSWGLVPFTIFWIGYLIIVFYKTSEKIFRYQFGGVKQI